VAVRSGGCSGSGELVLAILFASKAKEQAHKLQGRKRNRKQPRAWCATHWNSAATEGVSRQRFLPELEKTEERRRLSGLGSELGGALGSQGGGEDGGALGWLGKGSRGMNFMVARVLLVGVRGSKRRRVGRWRDLNHEWRRRSASTSPGDAGKQAGCVPACTHEALRARWPRWTGAP